MVLVFLWSIPRVLHAAGPQAEPEKYADYGGTPDLVMSGDIQLSTEELESLLTKLGSDSLKDRVEAAAEIRQNAPGAEAVYRAALWRSGNASHRQIKEVMKSAEGTSDAEGGIIGALVQMPPSSDAVRVATRVVVMLVSLHSLDTMAGYKVLLDFSGRYAGAFRGFIGDLMVHAGLKALPALIYGRGSKNKELHMFSVAWIRDMGNPLLSEQIQGIQNSRRLAQLLEAYASVNELDAIDVTLSCANHQSAIVRRAARACLEAYGRNAKWSIHREYENHFGDEPQSGDYEQWVQQLYDAWDSQRQSKTVSLFESGADAAKAGQFKKMDAIYRELLSMSPLNPHRSPMADDYLAYATKLENDGDHEAAIKATKMARRLSEEDTPAYREATARLEWLHAEKLRSNGALDVAAYKKLQQNPELQADAAHWANYGQTDKNKTAIRWPAVIAVSFIVFICMLLLYWRIRARG